MGSRGRNPPPHFRRPLPGPSMVHTEPFGPTLGHFPPFSMLPPPEVMEQKLATQHVEMQRLATENQRLATTQGNLRQELVATQHELQMLHSQIGAMKSEREQRRRGLVDKVAKMEIELQRAEAVKLELQKARTDAQNLVIARDELMSKVHQLTQDLQNARSEVQQIPALMSELENLRQEYQHCKATYDYEKKFYSDHLESLQAMDKNYMTMAMEVEKLQAQLMSNNANMDRRAGVPYGSTTGSKENDVSRHQAGHNPYEDAYGVHQRHVPLSSGHIARGNPAVAGAGAGAGAGAPPPAYGGGPQQGYLPARPGYEAAARVPGYDPSRAGPHGYNLPRGGPGYDPTARVGPGPPGPHGGQFAIGPAAANLHYGSTVLPVPRGGNPGRR